MQQFVSQKDRVVFLICCSISQMALPNSYRLTNNPITVSCISSVLEKQIVFLVKRFIRVRNVKCLRSIF
jgi:hypothetical protein